MADILALVEHRQGLIRDITFELFSLGRDLAHKLNCKLIGVVLADDANKFTPDLAKAAHGLIVVESQIFSNFNSECYQQALSQIIDQKKPLIVLIGHTAFGMDLAPSLATSIGLPLATDCIDLSVEDGRIWAVRQMYEGKINAKLWLRESPTSVITIRSGVFGDKESHLEAEIENLNLEINQPDYRRFFEYVEPVTGDVDITKSDIVVGVGRGIKEKENLALVEDFAKAIGGVVGCTRPIVDAEWLPKDRQIGSSGKTIKPKLYIAIGVSGAFQHVAGMKGAETIIAINKDPNAPIFNEADYGIVDDLFKVLPALKTKLLEMKK
ncbi:MAG: electron transfer flavoprotein subunit alpha/FixB family protein [bacterium]